MQSLLHKKSRKALLDTIFRFVAKFKLEILFLAGTLLLIFSWHTNKTTFLIFFAFIPVFYFLDKPSRTYNDQLKFNILSFLSVFFWVYFTIYWIHPINSMSHFFTTLVSSTILFLPYLLAFSINPSNSKSPSKSIVTFISAWIVIELLHDINILGFPYLNLGHVLASHPKLIQWYSIVGSVGGTFWILLVNLTLYSWIINFTKKQKSKKYYIKQLSLTLLVFVPPILSISIIKNDENIKNTSVEIIDVRTSVDVYDYKYEVPPDTLLKEYIITTKKSLDTSSYQIIIWPENALTGYIYFNSIDSSPSIQKIKNELIFNPKKYLITGAVVDEIVGKPDENIYAPNILYNKEKEQYFKRYNTALYISYSQETKIKTKKRLVPFGEKIPPQKIFSPMVKLLPNLADLNFSSLDEEYPVYSIPEKNVQTNPIICYGSAYSSYVANETLTAKSNFLVVILNEGWMRSKKAYNHFNWFSICRAIENNRYLIKSSNDGISAIIKQNGEIEDYFMGKGDAVVKGNLKINNKSTFYTKNHKIIVILFLLISGIVLFTSIISYKLNKKTE